MTLLTNKIIGEKHGKLTVVSVLGVGGLVLVKCECGTSKEIGYNVIKRGITVSCGCYHVGNLKHGLCSSAEHRAWSNIKARCTKPVRADYKNYGGRGIKVCDRWFNSFENFIQDMGLKPSPNMTIERIDVNGDYCPENCTWASRKVQANTKRNNRKLTYKGITKNIGEWASELNVKKPNSIHKMLRRKGDFGKVVEYYLEKNNLKIWI